MMPITPETAIVTGASSGLGAGLARALGRLGVRVGLTARREAELEAVARSIRDAGGTAYVAPGDIADPASARDALARLIDALGPIDLLVANAGIGLGTRAATFSADDFAAEVRVNLLGPAYAIEAVLPGMLARRRGQVVGISSLAGYRGLPGSAGYSATKAGLSTFLEGLRPELRRAGIAVTAVHPGFVATPMTAGASRPQPFLMGEDRAVAIILRGILGRKRRVDFPLPMVGLVRLLANLPGWAFDRFGDRLVNG